MQTILILLSSLCLAATQVHLSDNSLVSDIQCTFTGFGHGKRDSIAAKVRKPDGFKGHPLFADDSFVDPLIDPACQIRPDRSDPTELTYNLLITDFARCGVSQINGFVHVKLWFPQFPGVVMMADRDVIVMCKPPEPVVIENKAAGFAGSMSHAARVSGVVEESPGHLEYEVALYKEAPANNKSNEMTVDQAVSIGTKLQLRARINPDSAWKYVKLMEVSVSPDADNPHERGSVSLVRKGCKNPDFASIIPHQPALYNNRTFEVFLDFEAFLLASMKERSTLWIHSQIKACMDAADCQPEFCLDILNPQGHGRRRRDAFPEMLPVPSSLTSRFTTNQSSNFNGNIEYTVLMPGELYQRTAAMENTCSTFLYIAAILGILLFLSALIMCYLASRLHGVIEKSHPVLFDRIPPPKYSSDKSSYTGRATLQ